jgi:hypothetical protein
MKLSVIASAFALFCLVGGTTLALASATPASAAAHKGGKVTKTSKGHKGKGKGHKVVTGGYG